MSKKQRKAPTLKERLTPCVICLHPLSQRHHLLSFKVHGEKGVGTVQLCANCHDLYHLFERVSRKIRRVGKTECLFDIPTEEEKLIERLGSRPEYRPLVHLASAITLLSTILSQDGEYDDFSVEDKEGVLRCMKFAANFKQYVESERNRRDKEREDFFKVIREKGLYNDLLGVYPVGGNEHE